MQKGWNKIGLGGAIVLTGFLGACAQTPMGPTVQVMPGPGKSFDAFQQDQAGCKAYAGQQVAGEAQASNNRAVGAALLTTALGAGLGAAAGGGEGAGIGAAGGSVAGAGIGGSMSGNDQAMIQMQYDNSFAQCMYARGELVPGFAPAMAMGSEPAAVAAGPDPRLVRGVQSELDRLGYLNATPDGVMGPQTSRAIHAFEHAHGLRANGAVSHHLLAELQATPTSGGAVAASAPAPAAGGWVAPTQASASAAPGGWVPPTKTP